MATTPLVLLDTASTAVTYVTRSTNGNSMQYINQAATLSVPNTIDIKLEPKGAGVTGNDRFNISIKQSVLDSDNTPFTGSVSLTVSIPKCSQWTEAMTKALIRQMMGYLGGQASVVAGCTVTTAFPDNVSKLLMP